MTKHRFHNSYKSVPQWAYYLALIALVSVTLPHPGFGQTDYCSINKTNTMCMYQGKGLGPLCNQDPNHGPSSGTYDLPKDLIISLHNKLRRKVAKGEEARGRPGPQPSAADMMEVVWDDEIALVAQTWADQCNYKHDDNRNVPRGYVGQNIHKAFGGMATEQDWAKVIEGSWYSEVDKFPPSSVDNVATAPSSTGHYTQVVWGKTTRVGCGFRWFKYLDDFSWWLQVNAPPKPAPDFRVARYSVCNYFIGGNIQGAPVYTKGAPASACPSGSQAKDGLCTAGGTSGDFGVGSGGGFEGWINIFCHSCNIYWQRAWKELF